MKNLEAKFGSQKGKGTYYVHLFNSELIASKKKNKQYNPIAKVIVRGAQMASTIEELEKLYEEAAIEAVEESGLVYEYYPNRFEVK